MSIWIPAREISITWSHDTRYWNWTQDDSCSAEVAVLESVCWMDIWKNVNLRSLPLKTSYSAYLVFKLKDDAVNLERVFASVRYVKEISEGCIDQGYTVLIDTKSCDEGAKGRYPHVRRDGWSEIQLGEFFNNLGDDGEVELRLFEKDDLKWKSGLIIRGIDIRPN
ncbi:hypothetical protein ABFS82_14G292900 [Erythranthe guttata]|uniref:Uncharacterized protein n=1 Tax=Erythranthe guttata TaxID=4155 RepID=A0A022R8W6_ERYGU|nr:PREDICTED: F-box protein PP2-B11-like [Erythranthe guttata]EYU36716.1 hypothetical protein MIMGU_mgv1a015189mg [Erythranthe guttata]|eukprot:XP_012838394.1 PREDICTED: F-box protein PP2-B11-like [Erythranthe guttata]